jgi:hypothetical protein
MIEYTKSLQQPGKFQDLELHALSREVFKLAEAYFGKQSDENLGKLSLSISDLITRSSQRGYTHAQIHNLIEPQFISDPRQISTRLTIQLSRETNVEQFANKLSALNSVYLEILMLTGESESDYPLEIIKIESGSSLFDTKGLKAVVDLIDKWVSAVARFFYKTFTDDGKIAQIPRTTEAIESLLSARNSFNEAGIPTPDTDDALAKTLFSVAHNLQMLVADEPEVIVNGTRLSVGEELMNKYLETSERPALTSGKDGLETGSDA